MICRFLGFGYTIQGLVMLGAKPSIRATDTLTISNMSVIDPVPAASSQRSQQFSYLISSNSSNSSNRPNMTIWLNCQFNSKSKN